MFRPGTGPSVQRPLRRAAFLAVALLILFVATRVVSAPRPTPDATPSSASDRAPVGVRSAGDTVSALRPGYVAAALLLLGGAGFAYYLRRRDSAGPARRDLLQPVGKLQLGPGQQVHLVSCGDELLVIGTTASQVSLLKSMPAATLNASTAAPPPERTYRHEKHVSAVRTPVPQPAASTSAPASGFAEVLRRLGAPAQGAGTHSLS